MNFHRFLMTCLAVLMTGCATSRGFNRGELREEMSGKAAVSDEQIKKALALKPQLPKPFKLGVFFKEPVSKGRWDAPKWFWTEADKQKILSLGEALKTSGEASEVFAISDATISATDLKSLRLAAAQHGADALLVVSGVGDVDLYNNGWGWTYIALVTAIFVPASETDALFMARAAMWDVRNEFLYMTAEAESTVHQTRPAAYRDERTAVDQAKIATVDKLREEISRMVKGLSEKKGK